MSNFTDLDALAARAGRARALHALGRPTSRAPTSSSCPGTKATVEDLARLRARGLDAALAARAAAGDPILGICGGYQLLGERDRRRRRVRRAARSPASACCRCATALRRRQAPAPPSAAAARCSAPTSAATRSATAGVERARRRAAARADDGEPRAVARARRSAPRGTALLEHDDAPPRAAGAGSPRARGRASSPGTTLASPPSASARSTSSATSSRAPRHRPAARADRARRRRPTCPTSAARRCPVLRFITTADTEILATAAAVRAAARRLPGGALRQPGGARDLDAVPRRRPGRRARRRDPRPRRPPRLAGRRRPPAPSAAARDGIALIALGGEAEPDAEMTALSTVARRRRRPGRRVPAPRRRRQRRAAAALPRRHVPARGLRLRRADARSPTSASTCPAAATCTLERGARGPRPGAADRRHRFYRSHRLTGNTDFVDGLCAAIERAGGQPLPVWSYTLRRDRRRPRRRARAARRPRRRAGHDDARHRRRQRADAATARRRWRGTRRALEALDVPGRSRRSA